MGHDGINKILMEILQHTGEGVIVKGAFSTITHLREKDINVNHRLTQDIDLYLDKTKLKFAELKAIFAKLFDGQYHWEVRRHPKNHSLGNIRLYTLNEEDRIEILSIDVDVNPVYYVNKKEYNNNFTFYYAGIEDIVADKIDAISKPKVLNRIKDVYDLYLIATYCEVSLKRVEHSQTKIYKSQKEIEREESGLRFYDFINETAGLEYTYYNHFETLKQMSLRPNFEEVYSLAKEFTKPFIEKGYVLGKDAMWDTKEKTWVVSPDDFFKPSSVFQKK